MQIVTNMKAPFFLLSAIGLVWGSKSYDHGDSSSLASLARSSEIANPPSRSHLARDSFQHPGLLQSSADFDRIRAKVNAGAEPWTTAWNKFLQSPYTSSSYSPNPAETIYRGYDGTNPENYGQLYTDIAAAYALAVRWAISRDSQYGDAALRVLDAWSSTLKHLAGTVDVYLSAGIYGYQFAAAAEIMRSYEKWSSSDFESFQAMMLDVSYPLVDGWFKGHNNWESYAPSVYPGWDLCLIASAMSIGVLTDNQTIYNQGVNWYKNGTGNGNIHYAVPYKHFVDNEEFGQLMESGRDQGHSQLDIALLGVIGQISYNQGGDLYGYEDDVILAAYVSTSDTDPPVTSSRRLPRLNHSAVSNMGCYRSEYFARYNLGNDVPYTPFNNGYIDLPTISNASRGSIRPVWEILYNHYSVRRNLDVTWVKKFRDFVVGDNGGVEGGSGDYGGNSGGYDQLGWGTLLYTL